MLSTTITPYYIYKQQIKPTPSQHHNTSTGAPPHPNWGSATPRAPTQQIYYNFFSKNFVVKKQIAKFANVKMQEQHNTLHSDEEDLTKQNNRRTF